MRFLRTNLIFLLHKEPALTDGLLAALGSPTQTPDPAQERNLLSPNMPKQTVLCDPFFFSPSIFWFGSSTGDRTGMGPRISQPLALLLMPCSKAAPRLTPEAPHCPSLLTPSHLPHPGPVQSCIPKVHLHPPSLHFSPSFLTFHLIFPLSASALSSIPNTDRSDPSSHHKIPPTHHKPGGADEPHSHRAAVLGV